MSVPFQLQSTQSRCVRPRFPVRHGVPRVDDRRVPSRIIFATQGGLRWRNAPPGYGPHKTLYNRFARAPTGGGCLTASSAPSQARQASLTG